MTDYADQLTIDALKRQILHLETQVRESKNLNNDVLQDRILKGQCFNNSAVFLSALGDVNFTADGVRISAEQKAKTIFDFAATLYKEARGRGWPEFINAPDEKSEQGNKG